MLINKKFLLGIFFIIGFQFSCIADSNNLPPTLNKSAFDGFTISSDKVLLNGYEYKNNDRKIISFDNCKNTLNFNISDIVEHDYFRFKLLLTSCKAVKKYYKAKSSEKTFFPNNFKNSNYKDFPALATPFLSKTEYRRRSNKTIEQAYKTLTVTSKNNTATFITDEDEIYITVLARGDFNNDKIEDLLVTSEWYAKHANGKHTELVILSKTGKDKPIKIDWRMNTLK